MRSILAVDSGGSKSEAALVRDDGTIFGWGICRTPGVNGRSERATREAARAALGSAGAGLGEFHVACLGNDVPEGLFEAAGPSVEQVHVLGEHDGPLALVDREHGVVVLSGTGAFVHVEAPDGRSLRLDGLGPLLGDWGSGYQIGYLALRAAMRSAWHPRRRTALEETILAAFEASDVCQMLSLNFAYLDRSVVASLATDVNRLAEAGDAIARQILEEAAEALAATLRDALDSLELAEASLNMVGTGSVAKQSAIFWEHFCRLATECAPNLMPVLEPLPSAAGMALAVLRAFPGVDQRLVRENLFESAGQFLNRMEKQCP